MAKLKLLIAGGGSTVEILLRDPIVKELIEEIIIIESDSERKAVLERLGDVYVIEGDATDTSIYSSINMREITTTIAATSRDEVNFLVLAVAKTYNVPIRIGIFKDEKIGDVVKSLKLGIPVVKPAVTAGVLKQILSSITRAVELSSFPIVADYKLYKVTIKEDDLVEGTRLEELHLEENDAYIIMIFNGKELIPPSPNVQITPGFTLFIMAKNDDFLKTIKGIG